MSSAFVVVVAVLSGVDRGLRLAQGNPRRPRGDLQSIFEKVRSIVRNLRIT
jgi:hypothetical protein